MRAEVFCAGRPAAVSALQAQSSELEGLLERAASHWCEEDGVYRFYHQSFKVYDLQQTTTDIVRALEQVLPEVPLNPWFLEIVREGTGRRFEPGHNQRWLAETRPILEAFFHAKYFLTMACKYARELDEAPRMMPSGWAAVLYLYGMR